MRADKVRVRTIHRRTPQAEDGFAMSSPMALMSAAAVVLAGVAFLTTGHDSTGAGQAVLVSGPAPVEQAVTLESKRPAKPVVERGETYVAVFNNSNISGLAGATANRIDSAGWQVVASDNWYGTIPASTIYYPPRLKEAAEMLSQDLGIERLMPSVDPMQMDRLTVILTADFA